MWWGWLAACTGPEPAKGPGPGDDDDDVTLHSATTEPAHSAGHSAATAHTGATTPTALYPPIEVDCAVPPPPGPFDSRTLPGIRSTEDLAFDTEGSLVAGEFYGPLVAYARDGTRRVVADPDETRGIDVLPDGRLLVSDPDTGTLLAIDGATGSTVVLAALDRGLSGLDVDTDGTVYLGNLSFIDGRFYAVAADGTSERFADVGYGAQSYGTALSPDEQRLYLTRYNAAEIWVSDRGPTGAFGDATLWASGQPVGGWSGAVTDACGRVYVMDAFTCAVWRFDPVTAEGELLFQGPRRWYCANLAFGRGLGGFGATQLYVSTYEEVIEIDVGVPGRPR